VIKMSNRITAISRAERVTLPSEAEITFTVFAERLTPTTELRGRVTGPTCHGLHTVEVAYPLRPLARPAGEGLAARAIIPEASLWEPQRPFLYRVFLELWQDNQRCDRRTFSCGFRTVHLGARGLHWNGFPLTLQGRRQAPATPQEAAELRQGGVNLLVVPIEEAATWPLAVDMGFLLLGRMPLTEMALARAAELSGHVCSLGWLLPSESLDAGPRCDEGLARLRALKTLVGVELSAAPAGPLLPGVDFVVCPEEAAQREPIPWPRIITTTATPAQHIPAVLGWLH
jgi:hypothetical protein